MTSLAIHAETTHQTQNSLEEPAFSSKYLENGMLVSIYEDQRMPVATVELVYNVGSAHEDDDSRGLAHLFEHLMISSPTDRFPDRAVFKYVDEFGGSANATTSLDETNYYALAPPDRVHRILEIFADRMINLKLTDENLEREKKVVLEELRVSAQNDPINRMAFEALKRGFGDHPYAISPLGTEESVNSATIKSCYDFYERYYGPKNSHLIVSGAVDSDSVFEFVNHVFGSISKEVETPGDIPLLTEWQFPSEVLLSDDIPPVEAAAYVYALPAASADDFEVVNVMITLLLGIDGFDDVLVREKRKALYAQVLWITTKAGRGLAFGSVSLPYRKKDAAYQYLQESLAHLGEFHWLTEASLDATKKLYLQSEYRGRYSSAAMATRIRFAHGSQQDIQRAFDREERINAIQIDDIKDAYERYVLQAKPVRVYVEPEHVPWYVKAFGRLYPLAARLGFVNFGL